MIFQISSSLLDACVLAILQSGDTYGYELTQNVKAIIDISESTLYPVLRRLQKDKYLETYDMPYQGRNRRYYKLTDEGRKKFKEFKQEWKDYKARLDKVMGTKEKGGKN